MITAKNYQELIMNFMFLLEVDEQNCWFLHDGATAHIANSTMHKLSEFFGWCNISQNLWTPQSLEVSPMYFCL
jgi:hypothetical protein